MTFILETSQQDGGVISKPVPAKTATSESFLLSPILNCLRLLKVTAKTSTMIIWSKDRWQKSKSPIASFD